MNLDRCSSSSGFVVTDLDEAFGYNTVQCFVTFDEAINFIRQQILDNNADNDEYQGKGWQLYSVQSGMTCLATFWNYTKNLPDLLKTQEQLWTEHAERHMKSRDEREDAISSVRFLNLDEMTSDQRLQMQCLSYWVLGRGTIHDIPEIASRIYPISSDVIRKLIIGISKERDFGGIELTDLKRLVNWLSQIGPSVEE